MNEPYGLGHVSIIVPAAGEGSRIGAGVPKQYLPILGKPLLQHTLERVLALGAGRVVLVVAASDTEYLKLAGHEQCQVVVGGQTRAESVLAALNALDVGDDEWVLVHDGARPCLRPEDVVRLVAAVDADSANVGGLLAVPAIDTIKQVATGKVQKTLDRSALWLAQTPQMFRRGLLRRAMENALAAGEPVTDEASAVEHLGLQPLIVEGHADNIKVTTAADLPLAAYYLSEQDHA